MGKMGVVFISIPAMVSVASVDLLGDPSKPDMAKALWTPRYPTR